jgi:hypothetical protein
LWAIFLPCSGWRSSFYNLSYPKANPNIYGELECTTEHVSENLASRIAKLLNLPCAKVDLGTRDGRIGSMSYQINDAHSIIIEGIGFICNLYSDYDQDKKYSLSANQYYSIQMVKDSLASSTINFLPPFLNMLIFDALIGNRDRHQNNWAILLKVQNDNPVIQFCPLYDNGSSLCCFVQESQVNSYTGKDMKHFLALVDSKSRSRVRIDPTSKREPTHREVLEYIREQHFDHVKPFIAKISSSLDEVTVKDIIAEYPDELLSKEKKELIYRFIMSKRDLILELFSE